MKPYLIICISFIENNMNVKQVLQQVLRFLKEQLFLNMIYGSCNVLKEIYKYSVKLMENILDLYGFIISKC